MCYAKTVNQQFFNSEVSMSENVSFVSYQKEMKRLFGLVKQKTNGVSKASVDKAEAQLELLLRSVQGIFQKYNNGRSDGSIPKESAAIVPAAKMPVKPNPTPDKLVSKPKPPPSDLNELMDLDLGKMEAPQVLADAVEAAVLEMKAESVKTSPAVKTSAVSAKDQLTKLWAPLGVEVLSVHEDSEIESSLNSLAAKLGDVFSALREPFRIIKASYSFEGKGNFLLTKYVPDKKSQQHVISFFEFAKRMSLLEYRIEHRPKLPVSFRINTEIDEFRKFITGDWFERCVYSKIAKAFHCLGDELLIVRNVKVKFPDGKNELDLVIVHQGKAYIMEVKSRKYSDAVNKYRHHAKGLKIPLENIFFVMLEKEEGIDHKMLEHFHKMRFVFINELIGELTPHLAPRSKSVMAAS